MDLLADIGGTNARVTFRSATGAALPVFTRNTGKFPDLSALLQDVIAEVGMAPQRAAIAVAGPVTGEIVTLTNLPWTFSAPQLAVDLSVNRLIVENDVAAMAWALSTLTQHDVVPLTPGPVTTATKVLVAPGTGLGVAALAARGDRGWTVVASEGGHARFAPPPALAEANGLMTQSEGWSWEDLVSGSGLPRLYRVLDGPDRPATPEAVTSLAFGGNPAAVRCMDIFCQLLGAFAGDMALVFGAKGGCYLAGGLIGSIGPLFKPDLFLAGFREKDRFGVYMADIPAVVVTHPHPALAGLAARLDAA
jgi:glucokinase